MIDLKDVLLMPVAGGLFSQRTHGDSAAVVAAPSLPSVRMPGAAQDVAGQSSAGIRPQMIAAVLSAAIADACAPHGRAMLTQAQKRLENLQALKVLESVASESFEML